jgi:hypothetical protein
MAARDQMESAPTITWKPRPRSDGIRARDAVERALCAVVEPIFDRGFVHDS